MIEALALLLWYGIIYLFYRRSAFSIMDQTGMNKRIYEKYSVVPNRFFKKHFKLSKHKIPIYIYIRLYVALGSAIVGVISMIVFLSLDCNINFWKTMVKAPFLYFIPDIITMPFFIHFMKKK